MESRADRDIAAIAIEAAVYVCCLLAFGAALAAISWLGTISAVALSASGQHAWRDGRSLGLLCWTTLNAAVPGVRPPLPFAKIDPAGNRVLQLISQDGPTRIESFVRKFGLGILLLVAAADTVLTITTDFRGGGDRPLGFLAGFGAVALVAAALFGLMTVVRRLAPKLPGLPATLRAKATPASQVFRRPGFTRGQPKNVLGMSGALTYAPVHERVSDGAGLEPNRPH